MPIFEYACQECGKLFEKLVRNGNRGEVSCPSCGAREVAQQLSRFAAHSASPARKEAGPMCPSGRVCPTPGACGLN